MRRDIAQTVLGFKLEEGERDDEVTSLSGLPLVVEFMRRAGISKLIKQQVKVKEKGWTEQELIETIILLVIAGGEHLEDVRMLEGDKALIKLLGKRRREVVEEGSKNTMKYFPSAKSLERFLKKFGGNEERPAESGSWVPKESKGLKGLAEVNRSITRTLIKQQGLKKVTIENDATAVVSYKEEALGMYKDGRGYMPVNGVIAELGIIGADEFRDGNVAPAYDVLTFFKETLLSLPEEVKEIETRLDGAYYNHEFIKYLKSKNISFSITGKLSTSIMEWIRSIPEREWKAVHRITARGKEETGKEWAEMPWTSANGTRKTMRERMLRTIVTRKKTYQWELFQNEHAEVVEKDRYEVIETNKDWEGETLIRWHYERGGSIEHVHDRIKNDLAGHVLPCGNFGANAAWWRLQCIAWNIVRAIQLHALPEAFRNCHLKKLRFYLFCVAGRVIRHARQIILKLTRGHPSFEMYREARRKIAQLVFS